MVQKFNPEKMDNNRFWYCAIQVVRRGCLRSNDCDTHFKIGRKEVRYY